MMGVSVREGCEFVWNGERNRQLHTYRPCLCGVCSKGRKGVGYLSCSDGGGLGFTIWIEDERVFRRLGRALRSMTGPIVDKPGSAEETADNLRAVCTNCNEGLQNTAPPKPDRIELLKQVRRATIDDQLHVLRWLETKFEKIRPKEK